MPVLKFGVSSVALILLGMASSGFAKADLILCPNQALGGGFGDTFTPFSGSQDGTCGADSGVTLGLTTDTNYAKLMWNTSTDPNGPSTQALPSDLTLGGFPDVSASVTFNADQAGDNPYFMVSFADPSDSLGQASAGDQILLIEFGNLGISGVGPTNMSLDPGSTLFNLYDNTTGHYLLGGQSDTNTINGWLASYAALGSDSVNGVWIAEGLSGGCTGPCSETLAVDSLDIASATPEPGTVALMFTGLAAVLVWRRRIAR